MKIKVHTSIRNGNEKETFELTTFGRYYEKNGSSFLQYEEVMEEGTIKSIVKVSEEEVLILRSGAVSMRMVFQKEKKLRGRYETPFGQMELTTRTKRLNHSYNEETNKGLVDLLYELNMQGSNAGTYHMEITFEEEK
ncbi:DUF1934 domain-containing protein [Bacillus sp. 31A1R]|uniref:DUF1934 domain-containing protein n=1 Tax=Robertmurraya mangrovi TaxID=3098077 RepID=A0ABU5IX71_9BACI|nr:DUF1934 domain-containing protein [Bacillus sp. 31A1R]